MDGWKAFGVVILFVVGLILTAIYIDKHYYKDEWQKVVVIEKSSGADKYGEVFYETIVRNQKTGKLEVVKGINVYVHQKGTVLYIKKHVRK